jgi:uncharacterized protein
MVPRKRLRASLSGDFYGTSRGATPNYVNAFAVQSRADTLPFDAQSIASEIRVPTLIAHSEHTACH